MEIFKRGNAAEDKNEMGDMISMTDDLEVMELGADDSAIQSAKAAVEAMKNNSYFERQPVGNTYSNDLAPTTPVFTPEQLGSEMTATPSDVSGAASVTTGAAPVTTGTASSAAEAVARLSGMSAAPVAEAVQEVAVEEEPVWKMNMDGIELAVQAKASDMEAAVRVQLDAVMDSVQKKLQDLQSAVSTQLQLSEDGVRTAVKEAGSSTEKIVEVQKFKMMSAFDLEKQKMNAKFDKKLKEMQEKHESEIRDLKEAHNQEITKIRDDKIAALDKMKQMYGDQMEEIQTAYREKNAALKREMDQYKEKLDILMLQQQEKPFISSAAEAVQAVQAVMADSTPVTEQ